MRRIFLTAVVLMALTTAAFADVTVSVATSPVRVRAYRVLTPRIVSAPLVVRQAEAPTYAIVRQPREPVAVRGVFADRVRIPRRTALTVEAQ